MKRTSSHLLITPNAYSVLGSALGLLRASNSVHLNSMDASQDLDNQEAGTRSGARNLNQVI